MAQPTPQSSKLTLLDHAVVAGPDGGEVVFAAYAGSVLEYRGGAIVNAANQGGVAGFGVDQMVNKACGPDIINERRGFKGIPTGTAKVSGAYNHTLVKKVIHATGPVFHRSYPEGNKMKSSAESVELHEQQLAGAYTSALQRAEECGLPTVGFCLLSAGVFRGNQPLPRVIQIGVEALKAAAAALLAASSGTAKLREVAMMAFTADEQKALAQVFQVAFPTAER